MQNFAILLNFNSSVLVLFRSADTYLDRILLSSFFTQGASGSRQTSWPEFFRVALPKSSRRKSIFNINKIPNIKRSLQSQLAGDGELRNLHDLCVVAVRVGRNQLHSTDVAANGFALSQDAAAVLLHSQTSFASYASSCKKQHMLTHCGRTQ